MNKIILFLVEGKSDQRSLALTMHRLLSDVDFRIVRTDITSDYDTTKENVEEKIFEQISFFLAENPSIRITDISHVIQIADTDATFIDDDMVEFDSNHEDAYVENNKILTSDPIGIRERNKRKAEVLKALSAKRIISDKSRINNCSEDKIVKLKYRIYYMSCDLEHVLHNKTNCSKEEKIELSEDFRRLSARNIDCLRDIIFAPNIDNSTSYDESWKYIMGNNSIKRKSNFAYFYREFIDND